jgi:hypothetical protein
MHDSGDNYLDVRRLWTDFQLMGDALYSAYDAAHRMNDFRIILTEPHYSRLTPTRTMEMHKRSLESLSNVIEKAAKMVVVSHHAPSIQSVHDRYRNDTLSAAFASNLEALIANNGIALWCHGHTHDSFDYVLPSKNHGGTRVVCNPRGYAPHQLNADFNPGLLIDI